MSKQISNLYADNVDFVVIQKIGLLDGTAVIHPTIKCKYQNSDGVCTIYNERFKINPNCNALKLLMDRDYILPEECPFTNLRPGYKAARVVSEEEFNSITKEEILKGNFNLIKLLDDILTDPNTTFKMIDSDEE
jgi:uncharacterized cysteine cluster protein YcgN (CxxCxxCC family)